MESAAELVAVVLDKGLGRGRERGGCIAHLNKNISMIRGIRSMILV